MLQRLSSSLDEELLVGGDLWSRAELEMMDREFCARVESAFSAGLESRAAAEASCIMNGKQRADELTIELAWRRFRDAKFEMTAVEVLARCPGVAPERVRVGVRRRVMEVALGEVHRQRIGFYDHGRKIQKAPEAQS
jgi:hypothetical protein